MLAYYRSQHANQSWLAALTVVADVSALAMLSGEGGLKRQAELTFAAGRHALVHTAAVFRIEPRSLPRDRLPPEAFSRLCRVLAAGRVALQPGSLSEAELGELRRMYELYANALGVSFLMVLPPWIPSGPAFDNWQLTSWKP